MQRAAATLVICLLGLVPASAQQPSDQLKLAHEMMTVMKSADNFDAVMPTIMQAMKPAITRGDAKAAKDWDEISPTIMKEFSSLKSSLLDDIAAIYANSFSAAELGQFVAFYKTPAGEKLARLTPVLAQQTMAAGQKFGQQVAGRLADRMQDELRKRGNKI